MSQRVAFCSAPLLPSSRCFTNGFTQGYRSPGTCSNRIGGSFHVTRRRRTPHAQLPAAKASVLSEDAVLQFQTSAGVHRLARAVKPDGKRNWIVVDAIGVSHSITAKQVSFILGTLDPAPTDLARLDQDCQERADENHELLQLVWEAVADDDWEGEKNTADVEAVAGIIFSDTTPLSLYATHLLLSQDKVFFKQRNIKGQILYEARSDGQVVEARLMQEAMAVREKLAETRKAAFERAFEDASLNPLKEILSTTELDEVVTALKSIASELDGGSKAGINFGSNVSSSFQNLPNETKELVKEALFSAGKKVLPSEAMELLVAWGVYTRHENLALHSSDIPHMSSFDGSIMDQVDDFLSDAPKDIDQEARKDLTHLTAYAVDSADTTEVDDAIAWDPDTNRVLVHVADPTRYFPDGPSNPIVQEALRRCATLYLPNDKYTMFPENLAEKLLSLDGVEADGSALTFAFSIDDEGALIQDSVTIEPTLISPPLRFTYEEVERILSETPQKEAEFDLHILYRKAEVRSHWREMEGGALIIKSPFTDLKVENVQSDTPDIELKALSTETKSWLLVSELMIAACTIGADFAAKNGIPVPFRGQEPFDYPDDDILDAIPHQVVRATVAFKFASPSRVATEPMEHATLGLDAYLQVTSPIRRSFDLITHFQLKAFLRGAALPFTEEEVQHRIGQGNDLFRKLRQIETRTKRYWQLEYLRRLGPKAKHDGVFLRQIKEGDYRVATVHLEEFGFALAAVVPSSSKPGSKLRLTVKESVPRTGFSRADAVLAGHPGETEEMLEILEDAFSDVTSESDLG